MIISVAYILMNPSGNTEDVIEIFTLDKKYWSCCKKNYQHINNGIKSLWWKSYWIENAALIAIFPLVDGSDKSRNIVPGAVIDRTAISRWHTNQNHLFLVCLPDLIYKNVEHLYGYVRNSLICGLSNTLN